MGAGEIFGFLGPNGAGKTTAMKMLLGLVQPTSGTGIVAGFDIVHQVLDVRKSCGVLPDPDNDQVHHDLGKLYLKIGRTDEAIAKFEQAISLNPGHQETYYYYGLTLKRKGLI